MSFFNRKNKWIEKQGYGLRIVGWGQVFPFFLPGEKKRLERAEAEAREMLELLTKQRNAEEDKK
jgi:hypothetical protein